MKISINNEELFTLSEIQKKVIQNDIQSEIFDSDMKRRLKYIIEHPADRYIEQNAKAIREFLKTQKVTTIPSDKMELAKLAFKFQPVTLSPKEAQKYVVKVNNLDFFEISDTTKKLLKIAVAKDTDVIEWAKGQLNFILTHKYERCMERLRLEWEPKLASKGIKEFPVDDDKFAELVFRQPDYKNRSQRDAQQTIVR